MKVTGIADSAFRKCTKLRYVRIPTTLIRYGSYAFSGCTSLVLNELDLRNVTSIGDCALSDTTVRKVITTGTAPYSSSLSSSYHPFYNVNGFESLCIIYGGTVIDNMLSSSMKRTIRRVNIPSTVTAIRENAFDGCSVLNVALTISSNVRSIGSCSFRNTGIVFSSVDLTGTTENNSVGNNAFSGTTVKKLIVGDRGVMNSNSVANVADTFYCVKGFDTLEYKDGTKTAPNVLSSSMRKTVTEIAVPGTVKTIADRAFADCTLLREIRIPRSATVGTNTFYNCSAAVRYY